jgi:hypothetical protein
VCHIFFIPALLDPSLSLSLAMGSMLAWNALRAVDLSRLARGVRFSFRDAVSTVPATGTAFHTDPGWGV